MAPGADGPIGKSAKAWLLVVGGMILVGAVNVFIAWKWFTPDDMDKYWTDPDAGLVVPDDAVRQPGLQAPRLHE